MIEDLSAGSQQLEGYRVELHGVENGLAGGGAGGVRSQREAREGAQDGRWAAPR